MNQYRTAPILSARLVSHQVPGPDHDHDARKELDPPVAGQGQAEGLRCSEEHDDDVEEDTARIGSEVARPFDGTARGREMSANAARIMARATHRTLNCAAGSSGL